MTRQPRNHRIKPRRQRSGFIEFFQLVGKIAQQRRGFR